MATKNLERILAIAEGVRTFLEFTGAASYDYVTNKVFSTGRFAGLRLLPSSTHKTFPLCLLQCNLHRRVVPQSKQLCYLLYGLPGRDSVVFNDYDLPGHEVAYYPEYRDNIGKLKELSLTRRCAIFCGFNSLGSVKSWPNFDKSKL